MQIPEDVAGRLKTINPAYLVERNGHARECVSFFYDEHGKLYLGEPGQYHNDLRRSIGLDLGMPDVKPGAIAGRFGPYDVPRWTGDDLTVPVVCFYPCRNPKLQSLTRPCLRELLGLVDPGTLYCVFGKPPVPLTELFGGTSRNSYNREMTRRGLLAPGHSIRAMHSEGFDRRLTRALLEL